MSLSVDYYFTPQSPWAYLGHARLVQLASTLGAEVRVLPIDLGGKIFPISGGLPLKQRAPQRQAYRLLELQRYSSFLGLPLNPKPRFYPVPCGDASRLIVAVDLHDGGQAALRMAGAMFKAVWAQERHIASEKVLAELLAECGLDPDRLEQSFSQAVHERYEANTWQAIEAGVFGAPTYGVDGEMFWGQDRLEFVERKLRSQAAAQATPVGSGAHSVQAD